ncbi:unnamed protein product [Mytilus coruscus]|uniref:Uncharacterized protein n=1 Tax=Mytilus coruscus TaxID=42192 RepID=A0A6J8DVW1_MYTCO|nr:unnamed protein product [Mytilus coruscus]
MSKDIDNFPVQLDKFNHQTIPFWTGYNSTLSEFRHEFAVVSYAPIVDAKPSDMSTVNTTMKRCSDMTKSMGQSYSNQTFDQQLYAIAKQVEWAMPETFKTHIIRLGGFHTLSCFIASIGKLWGDGGLKDLLIDPSVYAAGTVDQMMCGKQFNRAVRALTVVYEALVALWLSAFFLWCRDNDLMASFPDRFWSLMSEVVSNFKSDKDNNKSVNEALIVVRTILMPRLEEFRQWGCQLSPVFK